MRDCVCAIQLFWSYPIYYLNTYNMLAQSGIENEVAALAFPAHRLVVRAAIPSRICNTWGCTRSIELASSVVLNLWDNRNLNCLTVPTRATPLLTPWWPWPYLSSHHPCHFLHFYPFLYVHNVRIQHQLQNNLNRGNDQYIIYIEGSLLLLTWAASTNLGRPLPAINRN